MTEDQLQHQAPTADPPLGGVRHVSAQGDPSGVQRAAEIFKARRRERLAAEGSGEPPADSPTATPQGAAPTSPPANVHSPAPQPPVPGQAPQAAPGHYGQEGGQAEGSVSLTGQETNEDLQQVGFDVSDKTYDRIRHLARTAKEERENRHLLEQELQQLRGQIGAQQQVAPQQPPRLEPFSEAFPEDGSLEEQESWRIRKEAYGIAQAEVMKLAQSFAGVMTPMLQRQAMAEREQEWEQVSPGLRRIYVAREELEPMVDAILQSNPQLGLKTAVLASLENLGMADEFFARAGSAVRPPEPSPPAVSVPGSGRAERVPAAQPTAATPMEQVQELYRQAQEYAKSGRQDLADSMLSKAASIRRRLRASS